MEKVEEDKDLLFSFINNKILIENVERKNSFKVLIRTVIDRIKMLRLKYENYIQNKKNRIVRDLKHAHRKYNKIMI